ncbi:DUF4198 domain-containing protein [Pedobacter sp. SYP-B3415]|uniref:DUF4198 domain-containing protein n=1 Tax=Pedobacter sp. SYP-B3415 TaxID=2496641 RepID=UPI00101D9AF0|nr:DUF4198 domain-containing protein [Pedobacter sp. SYP-B3415]
MKKLLFAVFILLATTVQTFAHALWIETQSRGVKGQKQDVKIFFGEYAENERDSTAKWFSNMRSFQLALTGPDGKRVILPVTQESGFFSASFTPEKDGQYLLSVMHEVDEVYDGGKLQYYALAEVSVANKSRSKSPFETYFHIGGTTGAKQGQVSTMNLQFNKKAAVEQTITVVAPGARPAELKTGANGSADFKPTAAGPYFFEAVREEKKDGTHLGKPYNKIWHMVTLFTEVN